MRSILLAFVFLSSLSLTAQNVIDEVSFSYEGISHLEVDGSFAAVSITGSDSDKIDFQGKITGNPDQGSIKIKYEKTGSSIRVWIDRASNKGSWNSNLKGVFTFAVPQNIILDISNSSGALTVDNIKAATCNLGASSGAVNAKNITADTNLRTSSGKIIANNITGALTVRSSSGKQMLSGIDGSIQSVSSSGRIILNGTKGALDLKNSSGGIVGEAVTITSDSKLKCTSGSIKLELTKDIKAYTYDCTVSSGSIYIGDKRMDKKSYVQYGDILIEGVTSSGSQKYWN